MQNQEIDVAISAANRAARDAAIVTAWKLGTRTVTAISEQYSCSRDTVYRAIKAAGLDATPRPVHRGETLVTQRDANELKQRIERLEKSVQVLEEKANPVFTLTSPLPPMASGGMAGQTTYHTFTV